MPETAVGVAASVEGLDRRRVFFAEWLEPPLGAGHWLPEMIAFAGGIDVLGRAGEPSCATSSEAVPAHEPELVILGPCGLDALQALARTEDLALSCPAVVVDGDANYSRPAPRLADGVRQLAHLFHPGVAPDPGLPEFAPARQLTPCRRGVRSASRCRVLSAPCPECPRVLNAHVS